MLLLQNPCLSCLGTKKHTKYYMGENGMLRSKTKIKTEYRQTGGDGDYVVEIWR